MGHSPDPQTAEGEWVVTFLTPRASTARTLRAPQPRDGGWGAGLNLHRVVDGKLAEAEAMAEMLGAFSSRPTPSPAKAAWGP